MVFHSLGLLALTPASPWETTVGHQGVSTLHQTVLPRDRHPTAETATRGHLPYSRTCYEGTSTLQQNLSWGNIHHTAEPVMRGPPPYSRTCHEGTSTRQQNLSWGDLHPTAEPAMRGPPPYSRACTWGNTPTLFGCLVRGLVIWCPERSLGVLWWLVGGSLTELYKLYYN